MLSITARVITLSGIFLFVRHEDGISSPPAAIELGSDLGHDRDVPAAVDDRLPVKFPTRADITETVKDSWHIFISNVAVNLYSVPTSFSTGLLIKSVAVGHFAAPKDREGGTRSHRRCIPSRSERPAKPTIVFVNRKLLFIEGGISLVLSIALVLGANLIVRILFGKR